jgi:hypothetical protein
MLIRTLSQLQDRLVKLEDTLRKWRHFEYYDDCVCDRPGSTVLCYGDCCPSVEDCRCERCVHSCDICATLGMQDDKVDVIIVILLKQIH